MRTCCPIAACLKSRALLLWAVVLIPLCALVAVAVSVERDDPARAAGECCPAAAERGMAPSCQEMHLKLHTEASRAAERTHDSCPAVSHDSCPPATGSAAP